MALVHKALAVQKKEQAKLAVVEARLDELASVMEKMQEAELARCERLGRGQAVIEYIPTDDSKHYDVHVLMPPLYVRKFTCKGEEVQMFIDDVQFVPISENIYNRIKQLYYFFLRGR